MIAFVEVQPADFVCDPISKQGTCRTTLSAKAIGARSGLLSSSQVARSGPVRALPTQPEQSSSAYDSGRLGRCIRAILHQPEIGPSAKH